MHFKNRLAAAAAFGAVLLGAASANAAVVTKTYDFSLSNFVDVLGAHAPPLSTVTGSFTLTFDPAVGVSDDTADVTVNSLSDTDVNSPIGMSFAPPAAGNPLYISLGGILHGAGQIAQFSNDFVLQLKFLDPTNLDAPSLALCSEGFSCGSAPGTATASGYTLLDHSGAWLALDGTVTVEGGGGVPEPASWALIILGFGGVGAAVRSRRKAFATAA